MPATEADLAAMLDRLGVDYRRHEHEPVFTVEESLALRDRMPGAHSKNLFLKDRDGALWLVSCRDDRRFRVRELDRALGLKRASFGKPELLIEALGVRPGSVTPFAAINDPGRRVRVALDAQMMAAEVAHFHPLRNDATYALEPDGLRRFLDETGHAPVEIDFDAVEAASAAADG